MTALVLTETTPVDAPPELVWATLSDVVAWVDWLPTVSAVRPLDAAPLALGARYLIEQPKLRPAKWVVTVLDPPRRFVWQVRSFGLRVVAEHIVRPGSKDGSELELTMAFGGLLGGLVGRAYRGITREYLALEAQSLRRRVEGARSREREAPRVGDIARLR